MLLLHQFFFHLLIPAKQNEELTDYMLRCLLYNTTILRFANQVTQVGLYFQWNGQKAMQYSTLNLIRETPQMPVRSDIDRF